jgi:hypothetical protein
MLNAALGTVLAAGGLELQYETQLSNVPAIRVVSQLGFTPISSRFTLHLWTDGR